jgi:hypothetical protein
MMQGCNDADFYRAKALNCERRADEAATPTRHREAYLQAARMWRELAASARVQDSVSLAAGLASGDRA